MATMDLATTAIPTPTGAVRREKPLLKPMPPLTLTTATTDIDTATIPTMATATGEGRKGYVLSLSKYFSSYCHTAG